MTSVTIILVPDSLGDLRLPSELPPHTDLVTIVASDMVAAESDRRGGARDAAAGRQQLIHAEPRSRDALAAAVQVAEGEWCLFVEGGVDSVADIARMVTVALDSPAETQIIAAWQGTGEMPDGPTRVGELSAFPPITEPWGVCLRTAPLASLVGRARTSLVEELLAVATHIRFVPPAARITNRAWTAAETYNELAGLRTLDTYPRSPRLTALVLLVIRGILERELAVASRARERSPEDDSGILDAIRLLVRAIPERAILEFRAANLRAEQRVLLLSLRGSDIPAVAHTTVRGPSTETEIRYLHRGTETSERFAFEGSTVTPVQTKWRSIPYFGQRLVFERVAWLPGTGTPSILIDGRPARVGQSSYPPFAPSSVSAPSASPTVAPSRNTPPMPGTVPHRSASRWMRLARSMHRRMSATSRPSSGADTSPDLGRYDRAWLLMDRVTAAGDNAEHLYWFLRAQRPDINAWFVIDAASPDFSRLVDAGARVLGYRSSEHEEALFSAQIVASSFLDAEMTHPISDRVYPGGRRPWKFVYLQHGVLHNDMSLWFNTKPIDLMITATRSELASLTSDRTPYLLTDHTVALTGFPRHDALVRQMSPGARRSVLLLAPSWRLSLSGTKSLDGTRQLTADFETSDFARNWRGLAESAELAEIARAHDLRVVFLPHPNMRGQLPSMGHPLSVEIVEPDADVHGLLAHTRLLVTDYSSIAFDAAVVDAAVVYFQFDREQVLGGAHTYLRGDFDYEVDGLGPVAIDLHGATGAIENTLASGGAPFGPRRADARSLADGGASSRVVDAIWNRLIDPRRISPR